MCRRTDWTAENGAGDTQSFSSGPENAAEHAHTEANSEHRASSTEGRGTEDIEGEIDVWCWQNLHMPNYLYSFKVHLLVTLCFVPAIRQTEAALTRERIENTSLLPLTIPHTKVRHPVYIQNNLSIYIEPQFGRELNLNHVNHDSYQVVTMLYL